MVGVDGMFQDFGNSGFAGDPGDGVDNGCAGDLGNNFASLNLNFNLLFDWDIIALLGLNLFAFILGGPTPPSHSAPHSPNRRAGDAVDDLFASEENLFDSFCLLKMPKGITNKSILIKANSESFEMNRKK